MDAKAVQPKGKTGRADQALNLIQKLYGVEKQLSQTTTEEKQALRQTEAMPIMQQLKTWLDKTALQVPPKSTRSEEHTSELQSRPHLVCRLLLEKKKNKLYAQHHTIHTRKDTL